MAICAKKFKTAFAEETGRIAKMVEREIAQTISWPLRRIPETKFDPSMGHNPRTIRFQVTRPPEVEYVPMLPSGNESRNFPNPLTGEDIASTADKTGRGCLLPGETMHFGYDEFGRVLRGTALETDPICLMDIQEKYKVAQMIQSFRDKMPIFAKDHFANELLRQVIRLSKHKWTVAPGLPMSTNSPNFPALPTGGANVGLIRYMENLLRHEGWDAGSQTPMVNGRPALQVYMGRDSIDFAIQQRKLQLGVQVLQNSTTQMDGTFGMTEVYEGIQFIENPLPTRGYVVRTGANTYEFRVIPKTTYRGGVEGIVDDVNPDYHASFVNVGGAQYTVLEVGYIIHPRAMERQAMGPLMTVDGKASPKPFNFEVTMVDGSRIFSDPTCNKDDMYFQLRMRHAYAPLAYNPELMTAFLYIAATPQVIIVSPNTGANGASPASEPTSVEPFLPPQQENCVGCLTDAAIDRDPTAPADGSLFPADGTGTVRWSQLYYDVNEEAVGLTMVVERAGGDIGAASVVVTLTEGTATEPENFGIPTGFAGTTGVSTTFTKTLNWADNEFGKKSFVVPINATGGVDAGKQFTAVLGSVSGASLSSDTTATVTILEG